MCGSYVRIRATLATRHYPQGQTARCLGAMPPKAPRAKAKAKAAAHSDAQNIEDFIAQAAKDDMAAQASEESEYSESESASGEPPAKKRPGAAMKKPEAAPVNRTDRLKKHQWVKAVRDGGISGEIDDLVAGCSEKQRRDDIISSIIRHEDGKYRIEL